MKDLVVVVNVVKVTGLEVVVNDENNEVHVVKVTGLVVVVNEVKMTDLVTVVNVLKMTHSPNSVLFG